MTSATTKQVVIFCAMMFGCAAVAGATGLAPGVNYMSVTTQSAADTLNLGISETLTTNVGQLPNGSWVNEIDVRLTSISGTYLGTDTIPSDASVVGFAGKWSFPGGGAYLSSTSSSGTKGINPLDGAYAGDPSDVPPYSSASYTLFGDTDNPGFWANGNKSIIGFDTAGTSPGFATSGAGAGNNQYAYLATGINGNWYTSFTNCGIQSADETPGGTWSAPGGIPTGYGFDNTLLASFYVSPATQYAAFYTTDGNPWNVTSSTGGYGQFQFSYGGGRTSYVQIRSQSPPRSFCWPPGWWACWLTHGGAQVRTQTGCRYPGRHCRPSRQRRPADGSTSRFRGHGRRV